jgi:hypothetical protein
MVKYLVRELGADVNQASIDCGDTPLMMATTQKHMNVVKWLIKNGANPQATILGSCIMVPEAGAHIPISPNTTAAGISKAQGAPTELTTYLEAKTQCSNPGCSGAGLKKCAGCKLVRYSYCGKECQVAHWPAHKTDCKKIKEANKAKEERPDAKPGRNKGKGSK